MQEVHICIAHPLDNCLSLLDPVSVHVHKLNFSQTVFTFFCFLLIEQVRKSAIFFFNGIRANFEFLKSIEFSSPVLCVQFSQFVTYISLYFIIKIINMFSATFPHPGFCLQNFYHSYLQPFIYKMILY